MITTTAQTFNSGVCFAGAFVITPSRFVLFSGFLLICGFIWGFVAGYMARQRREKDQKVKTLEEEVKNLKSELANSKSQNK